LGLETGTRSDFVWYRAQWH